jgi:hypothetical protein
MPTGVFFPTCPAGFRFRARRRGVGFVRSTRLLRRGVVGLDARFRFFRARVSRSAPTRRTTSARDSPARAVAVATPARRSDSSARSDRRASRSNEAAAAAAAAAAASLGSSSAGAKTRRLGVRGCARGLAIAAGGGVLGRRRGVPGVETRGVVVVVRRGVRRADVSGSWRGRRRPLARVGALVVVRGGRGGGDPERPRSAHCVAERAGDGADDGTPRGRGRGRAHRRAERARASGGAREAMTRRARRAARPRFGVTRSIGRKRPRLRPERTRGIRRSGVRSSRAAVSFRGVSRW